MTMFCSGFWRVVPADSVLHRQSTQAQRTPICRLVVREEGLLDQRHRTLCMGTTVRNTRGDRPRVNPTCSGQCQTQPFDYVSNPFICTRISNQILCMPNSKPCNSDPFTYLTTPRTSSSSEIAPPHRRALLVRKCVVMHTTLDRSDTEI